MGRFWLSLVLSGLTFGSAAAQSRNGTRLLSQPAISGDRIAFVYGGDLWTSRLDGSDVRLDADYQETLPEFFKRRDALQPSDIPAAFSALYG